jgi:hypothetical protein
MLPHVLVLALALAAAISLAGCRQADGPMPVADGDVPNRLGDISRDLQSVAGGDAQARQDLADDLIVFAESRAGVRPAIEELARQTSEVVAGKTLDEQTAQRLAHQLWTAAVAREFSQRQVETLQNDTQALLVSIGVAEEQAQTVATRVGELQRVVSGRPRRWYEVF